MAGGSAAATVVMVALPATSGVDPYVCWNDAVQVAVSAPGADGVTHAAVPWSTLHVPVPEEQVVGAAPPTNDAGVTVPPFTATRICVTVVVLMPALGLPSALQTTCTVAPAATSPGGAEIVAVTVLASAVAGTAAATASIAYTYARILMGA
jgi:hypothetical protein